MVAPIGNNPVDRNLSELNNNIEKDKGVTQKKNNPLSANEDVQQAATAAANIHTGSGSADVLTKQALNLVVQNSSNYTQASKIDTNTVVQRTLDTVASESATGATVNPGMAPSEINSKPKT